MSFTQLSEYPKLKDYLMDQPEALAEAKNIYKELAATYSPSAVSKLESIFDASFAKLYSGISLQSSEGDDIKQMSKDSHLVLCPNHQSYADFLGITYAFHKKLALPIYIAAGINLNVFPLGNIFRKAGAFFIRRSFRGDDLYKLVLEAYIYMLLKEQKIIKFYFEGGRSRTGRLLPPRYGLFQMLLESYSHLDSDKPLCFLPLSISHERLPEAGAHKVEVSGGKKVKESSAQLFKIFKVFSKRFGSIHLRAGKGIYVRQINEDRRKQVQDLAFDCFRAVGKGMMVSPTSLLSMVVLDNISGALTKEHIEERCVGILQYCRDFSIAISPNLAKDWQAAINEALNLLISSKKLSIVKSTALQKTFYHVHEDSRIELLYLKNTILHHFLIPLFIAGAWINILRGSIDDIKSLNTYFLKQRKLLRHEFYLPTSEEMFAAIKVLVAKSLGRDSFDFAQSFQLDKKDFYKLGADLGPYASSFSHIYEAYYVAALSLKSCIGETFSIEDFKASSKEIFQVERDYGKMIRYPESYSVSIMQSALNYFVNEGILETVNADKDYLLPKNKQTHLDNYIETFATILSDFTALNIKKFQA